MMGSDGEVGRWWFVGFSIWRRSRDDTFFVGFVVVMTLLFFYVVFGRHF